METTELKQLYQPLTAETRVKDIDLPLVIPLGGEDIKVPKSLLRKDVHFLVDVSGTPVKAAWISQPLAHVLNNYRLESKTVKLNELGRALTATETYLNNLIKYDLLKDKQGPGAMAFCQANENIPKDSIMISERSYRALCDRNKKWRRAKTLSVTRFPNLGPETTKELKLIVNSEGISFKKEPKDLTGTIGERLPQLQDLLKSLESSDREESFVSEYLDAFYLHPETLKNSFQGDGDGKL